MDGTRSKLDTLARSQPRPLQVSPAYSKELLARSIDRARSATVSNPLHVYNEDRGLVPHSTIYVPQVCSRSTLMSTLLDLLVSLLDPHMSYLTSRSLCLLACADQV